MSADATTADFLNRKADYLDTIVQLREALTEDEKVRERSSLSPDDFYDAVDKIEERGNTAFHSLGKLIDSDNYSSPSSRTTAPCVENGACRNPGIVEGGGNPFRPTTRRSTEREGEGKMTSLMLVPIKELANATMRRIASISWIVLVMVSATPALARTWTDSSGTHKFEGEFVNLTDGNVDIRSEDGKVVHVPLEKLSEQDQKYVQKATSDRKKSRFIEAEGSGDTPEEALKDAFRAAVRSAVGAYVDEDTRVENDEVITDQVLTHSRGCIDNYEKLSEKSEDGVTHVTIRAVVKPDEVVNCLRKANVAMTDLSGEQFWANVTSKRQEEKDAESLLRKALEGFPENCLKAEPIGEPRQDHNETLTRLGITVRLAVDPQAYQTFSRELQRVLEQIAKRKREQETATRFEKQPDSEPPVFHWQPNSELPIHHSKSSSSSSLSEKFILALLGADHPPTQPTKSRTTARSSTQYAKNSSSLPNSKKPSSLPKRSFTTPTTPSMRISARTLYLR